MRQRRRRMLGAVLAALLLAGCGSASGGSTQSSGAGPLLADVQPVADPKAHQGPSTAQLAHTGLRPIADDPTPVLPATVTDVQGTQVTVADTSRILALDIYGTLARTVFELGLGDNVVGRDTSSGFAEIADRPLVTPVGHDLSAEAILALQPTVIITDTSLGPYDVLLQMREANIPVVFVDSTRSLDTVGPLISQVADALGVSEAGAALAERSAAEIDAKVAQIAAIAPAGPDRLRMVFLYIRGQSGVYYMFGAGSGVDSLITGLGGQDVATEIGWQGMRPLNDEGMVKAAPDLVLVMTDGLESAGGVDGLLDGHPSLAATPAGEHRRIVDMADAEILGFGPASADVLDALAVAVYAPTAS